MTLSFAVTHSDGWIRVRADVSHPGLAWTDAALSIGRTYADANGLVVHACVTPDGTVRDVTVDPTDQPGVFVLRLPIE